MCTAAEPQRLVRLHGALRLPTAVAARAAPVAQRTPQGSRGDRVDVRCRNVCAADDGTQLDTHNTRTDAPPVQEKHVEASDCPSSPDESLQFSKVRCPEPSDRVPPRPRGEALPDKPNLAPPTNTHSGPLRLTLVPQPGLEPDVMSLKPATPVEYRSGFKKPSPDFPSESRKSFRRAITPANV